jgi:hypothetical protein
LHSSPNQAPKKKRKKSIAKSKPRTYLEYVRITEECRLRMARWRAARKVARSEPAVPNLRCICTLKPRKEGEEDKSTDDIEVNKVLKESEDDPSFDKHLSGCFVVNEVMKPCEVKFQLKEGGALMYDVINISLTDPKGMRRILSVRGRNSHSLYDFFM